MGWYCGPRGLMRRRGLASKARCHVKGSFPWTPPYTYFNTPLTMVRADLFSSFSLRCDYSMAEICLFLVAPYVSLTWFSLEQSSDELAAFCELAGVFLWLRAPCQFPHYLVSPHWHETCPMPRIRGRPQRGSPWRPCRPSISPP
jgi:hypothetical protein